MVKIEEKKNRIRQTGDERAVSILVNCLALVFALCCFFPFLRVFSQAVSGDAQVMSGQIVLLPKGFTLKHIQYVFSSSAFMNSMQLTALATIVFTFVALMLTILLAYPLSRPYLRGRKQMNFFVVFTMLFNGGIIPTYLVVRMLGITNTFWALIVPNAISAYNCIVLITAFRAIPMEFEEAARVDGAGHFRILFQIMVPLAKPSIAVLLLWYAVFRWNGWFDALMYITDTGMRVLPLIIRNIINQGNSALTNVVRTNPSPTVAVQSASVLIAVLPILVLYPFLQKYFVKGVMIGGVKG